MLKSAAKKQKLLQNADDTTAVLSDIRVFKTEKRGRLEERHGRRGPGSNIRCSRYSAAGKLS